MRLSKVKRATCILVAVGAGVWAGVAQAKEFCCVCRGQSSGKAVEADDDFSASLDCSLICKRPTMPKAGACVVAGAPAAPAPTAPAPAAAPVPASARVLLFKSDDCAGDASVLTQSSGQLSGATAGMRSFMVESGAPASAFEKPDFAGQRSAPVGPTVCVSPGWDIAGVRIGTR